MFLLADEDGAGTVLESVPPLEVPELPVVVVVVAVAVGVAVELLPPLGVGVPLLAAAVMPTLRLCAFELLPIASVIDLVAVDALELTVTVQVSVLELPAFTVTVAEVESPVMLKTLVS